jgi:hypothetical protein
MPTEEPEVLDYLLGRASPSAREEIERRLFTDEPAHEELLAAIDDLIHAYLSGALSPEDRRRFESDFLAVPEHRRRLVFVRDLLAALDRSAEPRPGWRRWAVAAAAALAAGIVVLGLLAVWRPRPAPRLGVATGLAPSPHAPTPPVAEPTETRTITLPSRPAAVEIAVTPRTRFVRLELEAGEDRPGFSAVVRTADGKPVWQAYVPPPPEVGDPIVLTVPAARLASASYVLRIEAESLRQTRGKPFVREYPLRVVRAE